MKLSTNRAVILFLKENWIVALIILLLLWLLPKLLNVYALVLSNASTWVQRLENAPGNLFRNTAKGIREGIDNLIGNYGPGTGFVITGAIAAVAPAPVRVFVLAWQILDLWKGDEQITVTRRSTSPQQETDGGPVITPQNDFADQLGGF